MEYFDFDESVYCILDRDFEENRMHKRIFYTYYANLEADIMNVKNVEEVIKKYPLLITHSDHIKTLENITKELYKGKIIRKN